MPFLILEAEGCEPRRVELLDIAAEKSRAEAAMVWALTGELEAYREEVTRKLQEMGESVGKGVTVGEFKRAQIELEDEYLKRDRGLVGYLLLRTLRDPPASPTGDLTPTERGLPVYQALRDQGWAHEELGAAYTALLGMAERGELEERARLVKGVQARLDF